VQVNTVNKSLQKGFTLLELLVVTAILAIVVSLASPAMIEIIRNNRLQSMAADFSSLLKYARSEAKGQGQSVSISTIDNTVNWDNNTLIAFVDLNDDGVFNAGDTIIRRQIVTNDFTLTAQDALAANIASMTFLSSGFLASGQLTFTLCDVRPQWDAFQFDVLPSGMSFRGDFICP
jgi:type IV fimbrial biogenesis protein FimT